MDCPTPYNAILDQNWLHKMMVVPSSYHKLLSYHANGKVKEIKEDQSIARCCAVESMNMIKKGKQSSNTRMDILA